MVYVIYHMSVLEGHEKFTCVRVGFRLLPQLQLKDSNSVH